MAGSYVLYAVKVGATHIPVTSGGHNPAIEALVEGAASDIDPTQAHVRGTLPVLNFTTPALETALGICGATGTTELDGLAIPGGGVVVLYYAKLATGGYAAGSVHTTVTLNEGILVLNDITGDHRSPAIATYTLFATYDGSNLPFLVDPAVALPALTALAELFTVYQVVVNYAGPTTFQMPIQSASYNANISALHERAAADLHPTMAAVQAATPTIQFSTPAIVTALDVIGLDNLACTSVVLWFAKMAGPAFAAATNHISITANAPLLALRGVDAQHNQVATLNYEVLPINDGTEAIVNATGGNLPAASQLGELFTAGPATFDSYNFQLESWNLDTGLTILHEGNSGVTQPIMVGVTRRDPVVQMSAWDVPQLPPFGQTEANAIIYLRKIAQGGARVADATEEHVSFAMLAALSIAGPAQGDHGGRANQQLTLRPVKSGATAIIAIDTTAAIVTV